MKALSLTLLPATGGLGRGGDPRSGALPLPAVSVYSWSPTSRRWLEGIGSRGALESTATPAWVEDSASDSMSAQHSKICCQSRAQRPQSRPNIPDETHPAELLIISETETAPVALRVQVRRCVVRLEDPIWRKVDVADVARRERE